MKFRMAILLSAAIVLSSAAVYRLQLVLDAYRGETPYVEEFMRLPDPDELKTASLGYEALTADFLWLKAIQHMGEKRISSEGYDWIYKALDAVTTLDPQFVAPYVIGGLMLTVVAEKAELSNRLLEKGYIHNPDVWQIPFYLGFNYFYFMKQYKTAARYMSIAAEMDGSPKWLPLLASRLYYQADDPVYALEFLVRMYESTDDERLKERMLVRINELKSAMAAVVLQKVVDEYGKRFGRAPTDLKELVRSGLIDRIPEEPSGGYFFIDKDGMVRSSKLTGKLGVYTQGSR